MLMRGCSDETLSGCQSTDDEGSLTSVCYCNTDKCNGAAMTLSLGHVMIVFALFINIIVGHVL